MITVTQLARLEQDPSAADISEGLMDPAGALEFIWDGQQGFFELARKNGSGFARQLYSKDHALASLAGNDYFAPLPRKTRGSKKKDVTDVGNVVWVDIDELDGLEQRLARVPVRPSLIVASGKKGYWAYWKLSEPISSDQIEVWNRGLADVLEADHSWNKDRLARLPGSYRQETSKFAEVIEFSAAIFDPGEFRFLPEETAVVLPGHDQGGVSTTAGSYCRLPSAPKLKPRARQYIQEQQRVPGGQGGHYDRSREEFRIFLALVHQGWTDEQIIQFANLYRLPRHNAERERRRSYAWTELSLAKARTYAAENPPAPSTAKEDGKRPRQGDGVDILAKHRRRKQVLSLVRGQTTNELLGEMKSMPNMSRATAYRLLEKLRWNGYIRKERQGRSFHNYLTEEGRHRLESKGKPWVPLLDSRPDSV